MINKGILIDRQFDAELFADNLRLLREGKGLAPFTSEQSLSP